MIRPVPVVAAEEACLPDQPPADAVSRQAVARRYGTMGSIAFVPLWSSGILFGALALRHGRPFAVTGVRFVIAAGLLAAFALLRRAPWPRGRALVHAVIVGLLLQGAHYAGCYAAIAEGMSAGAVGLVVGLIPVLTALGAAPVLGERLTGRRLLAAGLGLGAALLVVGAQLGAGTNSAATLSMAALGLLGGAGAALWQKRFGVGGADLPSAAVQVATGAVVMGLCWWAVERSGPPIDWGLDFLWPFAWLVIANSVGANLLLLWLLDRGAAGRVTGLFFLVPPFTALVAVPMLGQTLTVNLIGAIMLAAGAVRLLATEPPLRRNPS
jgi:drug/metabolite transporter (DMT)-like permease